MTIMQPVATGIIEGICSEPAFYQHCRDHAGHERDVLRCNTDPTGYGGWDGRGTGYIALSAIPSVEKWTRYSKKTVKTRLGEIDVKILRDRNGSFEPPIISKYDRNADGIEGKILSLHAYGMSQRDISSRSRNSTMQRSLRSWSVRSAKRSCLRAPPGRTGLLEKVYPFIFMDAIHYMVKEDHRYVTKATYVVPGITIDVLKDILGVWIGKHESSKFWLNVLNETPKQGNCGCLFVLYIWTLRHDASHSSGLSKEPASVLHRPPDPKFHQVCQL